MMTVLRVLVCEGSRGSAVKLRRMLEHDHGLNLSNPTKVFPTPRLCGEKPGEYVPHPLESAGLAERF